MRAGLKKLIEMIQSKDPGERAAAAAELGSLGRKAHDALPYLFAALDDPDESVRRQAKIALTRVTAPRSEGGKSG